MALSRRNWMQMAAGFAAAVVPGARGAAAQFAKPAPRPAPTPGSDLGHSPYPRLPLTFASHRLGTDHCEACCVMDMNGDGRLDILSGAYWYENPGINGGKWTRHQYREVPINSEFVVDCSEYLLDVNKNGRLDLVTAGWQRDGIWWFENPGRADVMWQPRKICSSVDTEFMVLGDLMGTGKNEDLVACHFDSSGLIWVNFSGPQPVVRDIGIRIPRPANDPSRRNRPWPSTLGQGDGHGLGLGDLDGDGKSDILTRHGWFRNVDAANNRWEFRPEWDFADEPGFPLIVHDVNNDGKMDFIWGNGHNYGLYWMEQLGGGKWRRHLIDDSMSQVHSIALADIDGDGEPELIAGKRYRADPNPGNYDPLAIYYYKIDRRTQRFTRYPISYNGTAGVGTQILPVDIDGDGDVDLIVAGKTGVHWLENYTVDKMADATRDKYYLLYDYNWPFPGEGQEVAWQNAPADTPY